MSLSALKEGDQIGPWILKRKLGEGEYGTVFAASSNGLGTKEFAVKIAAVNKNRKKNLPAFLISHECTFYRIRFLAFMKDNEEIPHFPRSPTGSKKLISGTTEDNKYTYLAMELFPRSLSDYIAEYGGHLPEYLCYRIAASCLHIMHFIHSHYVIFNDIKIDNFMLRETSKGYQLVIVDFGAAEVKTKGKVTPSTGDRGTPLFTSINSNALGPMYYSDDISAISYMVCCILLGSLPWENCQSSTEILEMKKTNALESRLTDYPLLLKFVSSFKLVNTDNIDYAYWIDSFKEAAKSCSPERKSVDFLPYEVSQMNKKSISMIRKDSQSLSHKEPEKTGVTMQGSLVSSSQEIQKVLNQSPSSVKRSWKRKRSLSLMKSRKVRRVTPTRIQPFRACKRVLIVCLKQNHIYLSIAIL